MKRQVFFLGLLMLVIVAALAGCAGQSKPTIMIVSKVASNTIAEHQDVTIEAAATDAKGITRIELSADADVIFVANIDPPQKSVTAPLTWKAAAGQHTLSVRALSVDNVMSDPAALTLTIAKSAPEPTAAAPTSAPAPITVVAPTTAPGPAPTTKATAAPQPVACTPNAAFVADVTVPDGTQWHPNQAFNKIWRLKNTGNCAWSGQYQLAYVNGEAMSTVTAVAVPNTPPGSTADLLVAMTAPAALGQHQGNWQLRDPKGAFFGNPVRVMINVVNPAPPPQALVISPANGFRLTQGQVTRVTYQGNGNTELSSVTLYINGAAVAKQTSRNATRQITGVYDWQPGPGNYDVYAVALDILNQSTTSAHISGTVTNACQPSISFRADRTTINAGEHTMLRWDIECVKGVYLDGQGVSGHEARDVAPGGTRTYTLRVNKNDGSFEDRQVTIVVNSPVPPPPPPQRRNISGTWVSGEYGMELSEAIGCSSAECHVAGRLIHSRGVTTPEIDDVQGTINVNTGAVSLTIMRPGSSGGFSGTLDGSSTRLSGNLVGVGSITFTKQ